MKITNLAFSVKGRFLVAYSFDFFFTILDLQNTYIPPKSVFLRTNGIVDIKFTSEVEFYSIGLEHFYCWTTDQTNP